MVQSGKSDDRSFISALAFQTPANAIVLDVDGVLLDSLPPHLQICKDLAQELQLTIDIPSPDGFRGMIARGVKISPMYNFFVAVGFPRREAEVATRLYSERFADRYTVPTFPGIERMVKTCRPARRHWGSSRRTSKKTSSGLWLICYVISRRTVAFIMTPATLIGERVTR